MVEQLAKFGSGIAIVLTVMVHVQSKQLPEDFPMVLLNRVHFRVGFNALKGGGTRIFPEDISEEVNEDLGWAQVRCYTGAILGAKSCWRIFVSFDVGENYFLVKGPGPLGCPRRSAGSFACNCIFLDCKCDL